MPSIMSHNNENEVPHGINTNSRTAKVSRKVNTPRFSLLSCRSWKLSG